MVFDPRTEDTLVIVGSDFFLTVIGNTLPRADLNNQGGTVRNVHYGDILTRFGEVLDCEKDEVPYLNDGALLTASAQVLQDGDVILADTAEDDTVGKATEVYGLGKGRMVAGLHTIPCRVKKGDFVPKWLGYYTNFEEEATRFLEKYYPKALKEAIPVSIRQIAENMGLTIIEKELIFKGSSMEELFEMAKFDSYKEDNRREVKKAEGGLPNSLWDT